MNHRSLIVFFLCFTLFGCQTTSNNQSVLSPPIPKNSAVMLPSGSSVMMGKEVYSQVKAKVLQRYNCELFTIDKTEKSGGDIDLAIDGDGRLWKGVISETWKLNTCGTQRKFGIVVTPDGKGGIWLAIGE